MRAHSSFILKVETGNVCLYQRTLDSRSAAHGPPSSVAEHNSRVRWGKKYNIRRMSGQWIWKIKPDWRLKDSRMGKLEFFWAASGFLFIIVAVVVVYPYYHNVWGMDVGQMAVYFCYGYKDWQVISMNYRGQENWHQCSIWLWREDHGEKEGTVISAAVLYGRVLAYFTASPENRWVAQLSYCFFFFLSKNIQTAPFQLSCCVVRWLQILWSLWT